MSVLTLKGTATRRSLRSCAVHPRREEFGQVSVRRRFHRALEIRRCHRPSPVLSRVVANALPEQTVAEHLAQTMQHVRALLIDDRPIVGGRPIPVREDERSVAPGLAYLLVARACGVDVAIVGGPA